MVVVVVVVVALASVAGPLRSYLSQRAQIAAVRQDIAHRSQRVGSMQRAVARWDDPAYVAAQARSRLRLVMPGETGYVVLTGGPASPAPSTSSTSSTRTSPSAPTGAPPPSARSVEGGR